MSPANYARNVLRISIAQMLQTIGFQSAQSTALDILVELLERYIILLSKSSHEYSEIANRTEPTLDDIACAFEKYKVNISELEEFIKWVDTPEFVLKKHLKKAITDSETNNNLSESKIRNHNQSTSLPSKTKIKKSYWDYLGYCDDQNNKEILDRQSDEENEHIYDYFPLMTTRRKVLEFSLVEDLETPDFNNTNNGGLGLDSVLINDLNESINRVNSLDLSKHTTSEEMFVIKNGVKYDTKTWRPYYDSSTHILNYFKLNKLNRFSEKQIKNEQNTSEKMNQSLESVQDQNSSLIKKSNPIQPLAKLPKLYHKPRSKFKKQIFINAVTIYNKQNSSNAILLTASDQIIDDPIISNKLLKINKNGIKMNDMTDEFDNQGIALNNEEKDNDNDNKESETKIIEEENINIVAINEDNNTNHSEINAASLQVHNSLNKSLADKVFEAALNKYTSNENNETTKLNLIIKKENVNNASTSNFQIKAKNLADNNKKIPKLKISTSTFTVNQASNDDLNKLDQNYFDEFSSDYSISGHKSSSNINDDNDNAVDGLDEGIETLNQSNSKTIIEPLIWKPIFNNNSPNSTVPNSPKASITDLQLEAFTISKISEEKSILNGPEKQSTDSEVNIKHKKKKKNKDKDKEKNKNKEKDKEKKHDKKKKKDKDKDKEKEKDKDKDKSENNNPTSPTKKKDKKLKKLLKKEQKKLEKAAAAAAAVNSSVNTSCDQTEIKEDGSNKLEKRKSNENEIEPDSNKEQNSQPKLPKIKLKINSNQNNNSNNSNQDSKSINLQSNIVKPIKINFSNKNDETNNLKSNEIKQVLNNNTSTNDDEIELGEVVRPEKFNKPKTQGDLNSNNKSNISNYQNDNILKLKIKPLKAPSTSNVSSTPPSTVATGSLISDQINKSNSVPRQSSKNKDKKLPFPSQSPLIDPTDPNTAHLMTTLDSFLILQSLESQFKNTLFASTLSANLNNDNLLTNNIESEPGEINLKKRKFSINNNDEKFLEPNTSAFSNQLELMKQYQQNLNKQNTVKSNSSSSNKKKESNNNNNNSNSNIFSDIPMQTLNKNDSFQKNQHHRHSINQELMSDIQDEINYDIESTYEYKKEMQRIKDENLLRQQMNIDIQAFSSFLDQPQLMSNNTNYSKKVSKNNDTSCSNLKMSTNQNIKSNVKKNNLNNPSSNLINNDPETIFTPTITPVSKKSKQSPDSIVNKKSSSISPQQQQSSNNNNDDNNNISSNNNNSSISKSERMKIIGVQIIDQVTDQVWICPSCNSDRKSPMICCDSCDDWYHWTCIGINKEPPKNQNWYCHKCGTKTNILKNNDNNTQLSPNNNNPSSNKITSPPLNETNNTNNDQINYDKQNSTKIADLAIDNSNNNNTNNNQNSELDPSLLYSINDSNNYLNSIKKKKKSLNKELI